MMIDLRIGDCLDRMAEIPSNSMEACVCDPPYGLEFGGAAWDRLWETGAGMSKPGIGERRTPWPSFGSLNAFGGANPSCATCGGRLRGEKKCGCAKPDWYVRGEKVADPLSDEGLTMAAMQRAAMQQWHATWLSEVFRVLKPGGVVKAFAATRTLHRLAGAMNDAGFVGVNLEAWGYSTGFPKSHNVAVYMDKLIRHGKTREVRRHGVGNLNGRFADAVKGFESQSKGHTVESPEALLWLGWGTGLKPSWEPFVVGHKP